MIYIYLYRIGAKAKSTDNLEGSTSQLGNRTLLQKN